MDLSKKASKPSVVPVRPGPGEIMRHVVLGTCSISDLEPPLKKLQNCAPTLGQQRLRRRLEPQDHTLARQHPVRPLDGKRHQYLEKRFCRASTAGIFQIDLGRTSRRIPEGSGRKLFVTLYTS